MQARLIGLMLDFEGVLSVGPSCTLVYEISKSGEWLHRPAVRTALEQLGLCEEWDTAQDGPSELEIVNRTGAADVSF